MEWRLLLAFALAAMLVFREAASKNCDAAEGCCGFEPEPGMKIDTAPAANGKASPKNQPPSLKSNQDRPRVLITGSNQGIGLETSLALAHLGDYDLTMTCRSAEKCADTLKQVKKVAKAGIKLECEIVDFAKMASVKELADKFAKKAKLSDKDHFDVAILNAGILVPAELTTQDQLETSFQVNYLAQYLLLQTVISIRKTARPARPPLTVITMTSITRHVAWTTKVGHVTSDPHEWGVYVDPHVSRKTCSQVLAYARSKWATAALTVQLNNQFPRKELHAVTFNPGYTDTNMAGHSPDDNCLRKFVRDCISNTPAVAAKNIVYIVQHIDEFGPNQYRDEGTTRTLTGSVVDLDNLKKLQKLTDELLKHR